ncbi:MAG: hypothetical protein NUV84_00995 [Candidatus Uhrbacteria bacterium]|nr:hypothetical protein [Candidatus Uhrbacteria bacterium]
MPNFDQPRPPREAEPIQQEREIRVAEMDAAQLGAYKDWKRSVSSEVRSLVEGQLIGKKVRVDADGLPSVVEFYRAMRLVLEDPRVAVEALPVSDVVKKQIAALQNIKIGGGQVNLFSALASPRIGFDVKMNYVQTKLLPRLEFLRARDVRIAGQTREQEQGIDISGEDEEEEYSPHRAPEQESEGLPSEAIATMNPFFGGYVMGAVHDQYDSATNTWKTSGRSFSELPKQILDDARLRVYRSRVKGGRGAVKLPRGWGVDGASVTWSGNAPTDWSVVVDQNGVTRVKTQEEVSVGFSVNIAPSQDALTLAPPTGEVQEVTDRFPDELLSVAQEIMKASASSGVKARRIASFIHKHLEYDTDVKWEAVYKENQELYFEKIWEHKKAKCDEANTLLTRLLMKVGFPARFMGGHSVRAKSPTGEALLLESNRHAWTSVWDAQANEWVRLDATPAGDPNVDQEEQQEELGEGDYGEQEAEIMSAEELEKRLEEALAQEEEERERIEQEDPVNAWARKAECSPEEAREILEKIASLRKNYARVLADADKLWQTLVRQNVREKIVDRGPVAMSQMDEIDQDELVVGYVEMLVGEKDPLIGTKEYPERKKEKWFGGYEVYLMADLSASMGNSVGGAQKSKTQRDMVFLLVDSIMNAAVTAKQALQRLEAPMPVKVSLTVFGVKTEVVLPLTDHWTPKEQLKLYRALDAVAGGGTPDHDALALIEGQIKVAAKDEETLRSKKPALKKHRWKMRRFVVAVADGDSDKAHLAKAANKRLQEAGVPVDLLLIAPEGDENLQKAAEVVYPSVIPVPNVNDLAEKGLTRLTQRIKEAYSV